MGHRLVRSSTVALLLAVAACVPVQLEQAVKQAAAPSAEYGYVAGIFSSDRGSGFAFVLSDDAAHEYRMAFGNGKALEKRHRQPNMIALPPGTYSVRFWQTYALIGGSEKMVPTPPESPLRRSFAVRPGEVVFLGSFSTTTQVFFGGRKEWTIEFERLAAAEATSIVRFEYPYFRDAPVSCLLCDEAR